MADSSRRVVAVIPIRSGSRGLPNKNVTPLAGLPLYQHSVRHGLAAGADQVIISTDIPEVLSRDHGPQVTVRLRPPELATDQVQMDPVLREILSDPQFADDPIVVLLQATSPLRRPADITACIATYTAGEFGLVMSVCRADSAVLKFGMVDNGRFTALVSQHHPFQNRQSLPPVLRPNGAVYVFGAQSFRTRGTLATPDIGAYEMAPECSIDVDSAADLAKCEELLSNNEGGRL